MLVQAGVPPVAVGVAQHPYRVTEPKTVVRLFAASITALGAHCPTGSLPVGLSWLHTGVPPRPLALVSVHTSPNVLPATVPAPLCPPQIRRASQGKVMRARI